MRERLAATPAPPAGSEAEARAIERFQALFDDFTATALARGTAEVYADDAWLDDNLKTLRGAAAIRDYFVESAGHTEDTRIEFHDAARSGDDFYFRWTMTIRFKSLAGGRPVESAGMTHVRFSEQGKVLLHKDFWDPAAGLYEHVPVLGSLIRMVRRRI
jgi:ketosteroid isomerase-like protein